jgi:thiol-disulfide isomerase/thioredoxin
MHYEELSFFSFLEKMSADNASLVFMADFQAFLHYLIDYKAITKKRTSLAEMHWADRYEASTKWMKDSVAVFTLAHLLQKGVQEGNAFYMQACYEHYQSYPLSPFLKEKMKATFSLPYKEAFELHFATEPKLEDLLATLGKKLVYIDFWASWCKPCKEEFPHLYKTKKEIQHADFEVLFISMDENTLAWKNEVLRNKLSGWHFNPSVAHKKEIEAKYSVPSLPYGVLVDSKGKMLRGNVPRFSHGDKAKLCIMEFLGK